MISFFRRALSSWVLLGLLGLIMIAFIVTGVGTPSGLDNLSGGGSNVAKVGSSSITSTDAASRVQAQLDGARQQNPGLDIGSFVRSGGVDQVVDQMINGRAFEQFGLKYGMTVSNRLVDGEIASIPAFRGPAGSFDRNTFLGVLAQRKLTERVVREDFARDKMTIPDLQATLLHLMGLDPYRLSYRYQGLQQRLIGPTDDGQIRRELLA